MKPDQFVLRWFSRETKSDYYQSSAAPFVDSQREACRYASGEEALASVESFSHYGADGAHDTSGWKAVRLVKKS
jgi:hypothetical protein